ncbi:hypothetical protein ACVXG7_19190 [Enterobacter hormaechei]
MTINLEDDKRRIYGVEGQVDYFFTDSDWSTGANFNAIKSETRENGKWEKLTVDGASPSKASAWVNWAPATGRYACRAHKPLTCLTPTVRRLMAITPLISRVATPCRWAKSAQRGEPAGRAHHRLGPARTGAV